MDNFLCPSCDGDNLCPVSSETHVAQKYDYKETTQIFYYKCNSCEKMFDEVIKSTGIRPLALNRYPKAEKLVNQ